MIAKKDSKTESIDSLTEVFSLPLAEDHEAQLPFQKKSLALLVREGYPLTLAQALVDIKPDYLHFIPKRTPGGPGVM